MAELDGPLSALQSAELVVPIASSGGARGVAGAPGGVVFGAGGVLDGTDRSIGMGRALVDAEKRCDLSLKSQLGLCQAAEKLLERIPGEISRVYLKDTGSSY